MSHCGGRHGELEQTGKETFDCINQLEKYFFHLFIFILFYLFYLFIFFFMFYIHYKIPVFFFFFRFFFLRNVGNSEIKFQLFAENNGCA